MRIVREEPVTAAIDWTAPDYDEVRRRHRWTVPERMNIADLVIDRRARVEPGRLALVSVDGDGRARRFTYGEVQDLVDRIAGAYASRGIGRGDRVGVFVGQGVENLVSHLAAHKLGAVSVPLSPLFRDEALGHRLRHSGARLLVADPEQLDVVAELHSAGALPRLEHLISTEDTGAAISWWNLARHAKPAATADTSAEDPAMLIYTSGTEGLPKGALHCHRFLPGRLAGMELMHRLESEPRGERPFWTPADWAWVAGLVDSVFVPLLFGCPVLAWRRRGFDAERIFRLIARERVRSMFLPPTALNLLRHVEDARARFGLDVFSVHTAGEPCAPVTYAWAHATFGHVYEFYGMTELALMIGNGPFFEVRPGSMGKPFPGYDVALLDADGRPVGTDEVGTIAVRRGHPGMFREYWEDPEGTAARFSGEWMITGDQATRDADGYLWYQGRADDMFNTSGYRVGPTEIESSLAHHPAVLRAAVVGEPDDERGMVVKAFVMLKDGYTPSEALAEDIRAYVRRHLAAYEYPRRIVFARELPMTVTGKVRRTELRKPGADARWGVPGGSPVQGTKNPSPSGV